MIFDADMDVVAKAARRWRDREAIRTERAGKPASETESRKRLGARIEHLARAASEAAAVPIAADRSPPSAAMLREVGLERTIGVSDFQGISFLELALAVSRFVGLIRIKTGSRTVGFGTGSMVSPRLLLTNNHVLPTAESAETSEVEFDYQLDRAGRQLQSHSFALQPKQFFKTSEELDFTLVAVAERSSLDREVGHYGWSRLIAEEGKITLNEHINIIQHPRGQFKQFVARNNELVDVLDNYLHYVTDTEPGSSGSPVYNDQWEIVALHHSGVPRMEGENYLDKNGNVWDGNDPEDIDWIANEGVRVSRIVSAIKEWPLEGEQQRMREDLLTKEPPHPLEAARQAADAVGVATGPQATPAPAVGPCTPYLRVTVELALPAALGGGSGTPATIVHAEPVPQAGGGAFAPAPGQAADDDPELQRAIAEARGAPARTYYDAAADKTARERYYSGLDAASMSPTELYRALQDLLTDTHKTQLRYAPAKHVYPWVDLHQTMPPRVLSIYSGKGFDPVELIREDFRIEREREKRAEMLSATTGGLSKEAMLDTLEAGLPFNCEHVVPQSWFDKKEPMRGDLHHLFACETGCNSFRGNFPYYDYPDFEEALRDACGKRENKGFEPSAGKGAVSRATLYFLIRYPGLVGNRPGELTAERIPTLLAWHKRYPVDEYERHRNAAIAEKQGNRNPLIDFPDWAAKVNFPLGLSGG